MVADPPDRRKPRTPKLETAGNRGDPESKFKSRHRITKCQVIAEGKSTIQNFLCVFWMIYFFIEGKFNTTELVSR